MAPPPSSGGRDVDPSSIGIMEGAFFVSRKELLEWVNNHLRLSLSKVEECASGAVYIQIIDSAHPGHVNMSKVRWNAKQEYEYTQNYKLLQAAFNKIGIKKHIEVEKLIRAKAQDNLEFLQWMKAYHDRMSERKPYDPVEKRKLAAASGMPDWALMDSHMPAPNLKRHDGSTDQRNVPSQIYKSLVVLPTSVSTDASRLANSPIPSLAQANGGTCSSISASCVTASPATVQKQMGELQAQLTKKDQTILELQTALDQEKAGREAAEYEKEFYFKKLRQIEIRCQVEKVDSMTSEELQRILYANDGAEGSDDAPDEYHTEPERTNLAS